MRERERGAPGNLEHFLRGSMAATHLGRCCEAVQWLKTKHTDANITAHLDGGREAAPGPPEHAAIAALSQQAVQLQVIHAHILERLQRNGGGGGVLVVEATCVQKASYCFTAR